MLPSDDRFVRHPITTATAFGLGSALLATAAFSFPPGGPPLRAIAAFAVALGLAVGIVTYVGVSALS
ncbi:hypothetical protein [Halorientalis regularis]|uniref:Uncharacterized protein n=1 Tax=Halorientalis regularis TaxID=660518 RepID=A0A1G7LYX3_9EURY|nr:hypothetical protein [Halorientalis regularis]SDF54643.1 hypothetical protein SAMN05216218_10774 [Halorientalis regularis]